MQIYRYYNSEAKGGFVIIAPSKAQADEYKRQMRLVGTYVGIDNRSPDTQAKSMDLAFCWPSPAGY